MPGNGVAAPLARTLRRKPRIKLGYSEAPLPTTSPDPSYEFNPLSCQADFTYTINLDVVKIMDTGKGAKALAE